MTTDTPKIKEILESSKTIAIIGCSPDKFRTSNYIAEYLQNKGYTIIPVNPNADEILGVVCYNSLMDIPESRAVDIVNIFRNSRYTESAIKETIEWSNREGKKPVVWTQLGVSSAEAEFLADTYDLIYVKNRCIMVEWERSML